jgi:LPS-assembly lipoprotein
VQRARRSWLFTVFGIGAASAMLSACGWHLRGNVKLPESLAITYIATEDEYTDFYRELRRALLEAGVQIPDYTARANAVVRVRKDTAGQRVAAISARNTPEEFQVYYTVDYSLEIAGAEVLPPQHVELTANYSYDTSVVLAKQREQRTIQLALARELAAQVLRRLASAKPQMKPIDTP